MTANEKRLKTWETAASYHLFHSLALCMLASAPIPPLAAQRVGACFIAGIALFSGSLYALVILDKPILGAITPIGGTAFIGGWALLALAA